MNTKGYYEELRRKAAATAWASSRWVTVEANATLQQIATVEAKIGVVRSARSSGLTWAGLAQSIGYGLDGPSDEMDWNRAGKSLQAWYANHDNPDADASRHAAQEAAVEDLQRAELDLDLVDEYADAVAMETINQELTSEAEAQARR